MPWFRLEDSFYDNPKVRRAGNAAVGLWVRCATWSARHLTDGVVAADIAHDYGTQREIDRLVTSGLWTPNGSGFIIPDYLEFNPSAEQVRADRAKARERARKLREKRGGER